MKVIRILATNPGCGKTHTLINTYLRDPHKCKYYLVPTNKLVQEISSKLKALGAVNPKVMTIASFLQNWRRIDNNGIVSYISTNQIGKRAPTKRLLDIFIDEASMVSKANMDLLISNFKIRNLIIAGDANQFLPIAQRQSISEIGSIKDFELYEDKGELFDYKFDQTFLLTKSMRAEDDVLKEWIERLKNKSAIYDIIYTCLTKQDNSSKYQHIAYTNKKCNDINNEIGKKEITQYIVRNSDKSFGLLKGKRFSSDDYYFKSQCTSKKSYFIEQEKLGKLNGVTADEKYDTWFDETFGLAYAVTCHKLQGSTINNKPIMIHLSDIMKCIEASKDNKDEYEKWIDNFHRFLYIAVSRATNCEQIFFSGDEYVARNLNNLKKYCNDIHAFDDKYKNAIITDSKNFNYDQICFYSDDEITEIEYAKSHTYKEYSKVYNRKERMYVELRKVSKLEVNQQFTSSFDEVQQFVTYKDANNCTLVNNSIFSLISNSVKSVSDKISSTLETLDDFFRPKPNIGDDYWINHK